MTGRGCTMRRFWRRTILARLVPAVMGSMAATTAPASAQGSESGRVSGFDHVAVPMRDTQAMLRFYRALGFMVREGTGICSVHFGDHKINFHRPRLWQDRAMTLRALSAQPPCGDFCFVWEGGAESLARTLAEASAEVIAGPVERTGGRDGGMARGMSWYVRDPDGNLLEFIVYG